MKYSLRRVAAACLAAGTLVSTAALARPDADHPAVARALAHLQAAQGVAGSGHGFQFRDVLIDRDGSEHVRFARQYRGLPVIGGDLVVHGSPQGALRRISQTLKQLPALSTDASVSADAATAVATEAFAGSLAEAARTQAVVYARGGQMRLAWEVRLAGPKANGRPAREHLIVDAHSGALLDRWDTLHSAAAVGSGQSLYSGTVPVNTDSLPAGGFALRDLTRGNHEVYDLAGKDAYFANPTGTLMTDADNAWGNGVQGTRSQSDGVDAMYGFASTWDFYSKRFGRAGIADDGVGGKSRVHAKNWGGALYNAFWSDDCFCMTYTNFAGPGNGTLVSLDVVGHEMTHGVTSNTAGLIYSGESGGLNEGASDIMGSMVERFANNANDPADYLIGEEIFGAATPLRNMVQPSTDGVSADCYYPEVGSIDVHYSSGVLNHLFYLLAEGSQPAAGPASPTCLAGDTRVATGNAVVLGIGARAASDVFYRALTVYMTSDSSFADARAAMLQSAVDLYGANSRQAKRVNAAWAAVNVR